MSGRVYCERLGGPSVDRLRGLIAESKAGDPLAPVTVLVPSTYVRLSLRRSLGQNGLANVHFEVPARLAELLGAALLAAKGRRPLTAALEAAAVRAAAAEAEGPLAHLRDHRILHRSLRATFRELRSSSDDALRRLGEQGGLTGEVVRLYTRFRASIVKFYDRDDLAHAAAEAVRTGQATGLADFGPILSYLVHEPSPGYLALVEALAAADRIRVVLGLTGDTEADAQVMTLAERLGPILGPAELPSSAASAATSQLVVAPNPNEEVRWVARSIARAAEEGKPFHRIAVLYRQTVPYAALVREQLPLAGVPVTGPSAPELADSAVGRALVGAITLIDRSFARDAVMAWLTGSPLAPENIGKHEFEPVRWDLMSRKSGVVKGVDQWQERLGRFALGLERSAEDALLEEEIAEAAAARMPTDAVAARRLAEFIGHLADALQPPADGGTWEAFAAWARHVLDRYVAHANLPEAEQNTLERIETGLAELATVGAFGQGPSLEGFRSALDELLAAPVGHLGQLGRGVFAGPLNTAVGMDFDVVHVIGMVEGAFPPRLEDDPLLPDQRRQATTDGSLRLREQRLAEERFAYRAALASAPAHFLSYPRANPGAARGQFPSRWFLEEATRLHGQHVYSSSLAALAGEPWLTIVESREQALRTAGDGTAVDLHDYDMLHLWRWQRVHGTIAGHYLAAEAPLARAIELERSRAVAELSEWDGNVSPVAGSSKRLLPAGRAISATSLQRWATCPLQYFLGNVLRISALDEPEELLTVSPMTRGSLVHAILEGFMRAAQQQGVLPGPGEGWNAAHRALLQDVARAEFAEYEGLGVTGQPLLWEIEQARIRRELDEFLREDEHIRAEYGVAPHAVEMRFGLPGAEQPAVGWGDLAFHGAVDRVDLDAAGQFALVLDYKTGLAGPYGVLNQDPLDRGRRLQLPIYALAARDALGPDARIRAAYWFVTDRGGFVLLPSEPVAFSDIEAGFATTVGAITEGIRGGLFPANPGDEAQRGFENCSYCDFDSVCPARRDQIWQRKQDAPGLAGYRALSGRS